MTFRLVFIIIKEWSYLTHFKRSQNYRPPPLDVIWLLTNLPDSQNSKTSIIFLLICPCLDFLLFKTRSASKCVNSFASVVFLREKKSEPNVLFDICKNFCQSKWFDCVQFFQGFVSLFFIFHFDSRSLVLSLFILLWIWQLIISSLSFSLSLFYLYLSSFEKMWSSRSKDQLSKKVRWEHFHQHTFFRVVKIWCYIFWAGIWIHNGSFYSIFFHWSLCFE